jgi:hypothetical protein
MSQKPKTDAEKATKTVTETILFTAKEAEGWKLPEFQRPLMVNAKVRDLADEIAADGGVVPGILTFGVLDKVKYLIDGRHRRESFLLSGKEEGYADTRTCYFDSMAAMAAEFVRLNSSLVRMKPDDILRGLEASLPQLQRIRKACPFVGYDQVRRSDHSPILSMSVLLRCWEGGKRDVPASSVSRGVVIAQGLQDDDVKELTRFLGCCFKAWGRDYEYQRLWASLNFTLCAWLYRRTVLTAHSGKSIRLTDDLFTKAMMSLSAETQYLDYLVGRHMGDRDRAPAYTRITNICASRIREETGKKAMFPRPAWALGQKRPGNSGEKS